MIANFVAPLYQRHKFDGTITNSIVYPVTRALYGRRIRQPIGGEFGFSARPAPRAAGKAAVEGASPMSDNGYKVDLVTTLVRRTVASLA